MKISHLAIILFALTDLSPLLGEWSLDVLDEALTYARPERNVQADFSVLADLELYLPETPSPGLLFPDDEAWLNPRLAVFFDLSVGSVVQIHSQMRVDRGFDPGSVPSGEGRLDEYYLRVSPLEDDRMAFKVGKFATAFGNWATRNLSWDNPFVTAPLAYEDVLNVSDVTMPRSAQALVGRRRVADRKGDWLTAIWGPSYASGASVSGRIEKLDYAFEVKNAALSISVGTGYGGGGGGGENGGGGGAFGDVVALRARTGAPVGAVGAKSRSVWQCTIDRRCMPGSAF